MWRCFPRTRTRIPPCWRTVSPKRASHSTDASVKCATRTWRFAPRRTAHLWPSPSKRRPTSHSINWFLTPSQMLWIASSSAGAAAALTGCAISRPPCCRLPRRGLPPLRLLRYQLLTAVAGSLAWARQLEAPLAVLVIHEFQTSADLRPKPSKECSGPRTVRHEAHGWRSARALPVGSLVGPIRVPGDPLFTQRAICTSGRSCVAFLPPVNNHFVRLDRAGSSAVARAAPYTS